MSSATKPAPSPRPQRPVRPQRADARRNRDHLIESAAALFEERGVDASLEEVAKRAHVGIGTLYRHFPNRDTLIEAVYRREVATLCDGVPDLLRDHPPEVALSRWMTSFARYVARKRGMAMALKTLLGADNPLFVESHDRIRTAITTLVEAAAATGSIRSDVDPMDLLRAMSGICLAADSPDWCERTGRLVSLLLDGLRYGAPSPTA